MHKIILLPQQVTIELSGEDTLLRELKAKGVPIKSSCGGHATCADCVVKIVRGDEHLSPPPFEELRLLGNVYHLTKERLCCQTKVSGEVVIDISEHEVGNFTIISTDSVKQVEVSTKVISSIRKKTSSMTSKLSPEKIRPKKGGFWRPKLSKIKK